MTHELLVPEGVLSSLLTLQEQFVTLCEEACECLEAERSALVALNADGVAECAFRKEALASRISVNRQALRDSLSHAGASERADGLLNYLDSTGKDRWERSLGGTRVAWERVQSNCENGQSLLRDSLRNIGALLGQLRLCLGENPRYSARGTSVDGGGTGKVIETEV